MDFDSEIISKYINAEKYNRLYDILPENKKRILNIQKNKLCSQDSYSELEEKIINLLLFKHYFIF
jgi:hypothetical protein